MSIINNITMLAIILSSAAVIREREHGLMDHLLTIPLSPVEIALAKGLANGFVICVASVFSLYALVWSVLTIPIAGSIPLFLVGGDAAEQRVGHFGERGKYAQCTQRWAARRFAGQSHSSAGSAS